MPSIKEIIQEEATNAHTIHLHSEGVFWKAYQRSAYLFLLHCSVKYTVKRRYVKTAECDVYSIGFPHTALSKHFNELDIKSICGKKLDIDVEELDIENYQAWIDSIPIVSDERNPVITMKEQKKSEIELRLQSFDLSNSTPIDCMILVSELQKLLNSSHGIV
jgi:hypothetical protein